jgi:hypothetical protein
MLPVVITTRDGSGGGLVFKVTCDPIVARVDFQRQKKIASI